MTVIISKTKRNERPFQGVEGTATSRGKAKARHSKNNKNNTDKMI